MHTREQIRPCDVDSARAEYLDCCLPDYFQGSDADEVLAVPMWHGVTYREAYKASIDEFHSSSGYFDDVSGAGDHVEHALHALFSGVADPNQPAEFAKYIEPSEGDDLDETVFLYIGLYAETDDEA